jgi:hypothetical protein
VDWQERNKDANTAITKAYLPKGYSLQKHWPNNIFLATGYAIAMKD